MLIVLPATVSCASSRAQVFLKKDDYDLLIPAGKCETPRTTKTKNYGLLMSKIRKRFVLNLVLVHLTVDQSLTLIVYLDPYFFQCLALNSYINVSFSSHEALTIDLLMRNKTSIPRNQRNTLYRTPMSEASRKYLTVERHYTWTNNVTNLGQQST